MALRAEMGRNRYRRRCVVSVACNDCVRARLESCDESVLVDAPQRGFTLFQMTTMDTGIDALTADIIADLDHHAPAVSKVMDHVDPETFAAFVTMIVSKVETVGGFDLSEYETDDDDDGDGDFGDDFDDDDEDDRWPGDTDDDEDEESE